MDPICHTFVGAALAQTGLGKKSAYGTLALVAGANLPDVDGVAMLAGADTALLFRRGWTHGIPAMLVLPLLLTGLVLLWSRFFGRSAAGPPARPGVLLGLSCLAVATHPSLDWMNNYGMRWLMPFDGTWFYGDTLFIIDPWMWLLLGGAVFLYASRRAGSLVLWTLFAAGAVFLLLSVPELLLAKTLWLGGVLALVALRLAGLGEDETVARRIARGALGAVVLYVALMSGLAAYARAEVQQALRARGIEVEELMVGPVPVTPFRREVVLRTPEAYRYGTASLWPRFELKLAPRRLPLPEDSLAVQTALASLSVEGFANWARFPFGELESWGPSGLAVYLLDARYTRERTEGFGAARVVLPPASTSPTGGR